MNNPQPSADPQANPSCPLCGSASTLAFQKGAYPIWDCGKCQHRFTPVQQPNHVADVYDDDYFFGGGAGYDDYLAEKEMLVATGEHYSKMLKQHMQPGRMLGIGCAAGFILQGFKNSGWKVAGVEPNHRVAQIAKDALGEDVYAGAFEDYSAEESFDLATVLQVLPHLADPRGAMHKLHGMLQPNGFCLIETWDRSSVTAKIFGKAWHEYSPPSVLHWFSRPSLQAMMESLGYEFVATGKPKKRIQVGHALSLLRHKAGSSRLGRIVTAPLILFPKNWVVPYLGNDVFWMLFRKIET